MNDIIEQLIERVCRLEELVSLFKEKRDEKEGKLPLTTPSNEEKEIEKENGSSLLGLRERKQKKLYHPNVKTVQNYIDQFMNGKDTKVTGQEFVDYYMSRGWLDDMGFPIYHWRNVVRKWIRYRQDLDRRAAERREHEQKKAALRGKTKSYAAPQFHETEAYLRTMEKEREQAVSYEEYKRRQAEGRLR